MTELSTMSGFVPWPAEAAARYVAAGYWEGRAIGSHIADSARARPDAVCLVDGPMRMTYGELMARADGAAARLAGLGIGAGDPVVIQLPNRWEHTVLTVACFRLGALPVWTMPQHREHELAGVLGHTGARAIVVPDVYKGFDHQELAHSLDVPHVLVAGSEVRAGSVSVAELCAPGDVSFDADPPDGTHIATFLLSGGTTGLPKLAPRTHNDLSYSVKRMVELCGFGPETVYLAVLPLGHGFVNTGPGVLGTLIAGGRVVLSPSPAPEVAFPLIARERVTATSTVPAIVQRWLAHAGDADLSSLRLVQVGAARLAPEVAARIRPSLGGAQLQQIFGMAEGLVCVTRLDDPDKIVHHTQGRPISPADEIRVVDEAGAPVAPGSPGLLLARGPCTPRGYYGSPEINARAYVGDGWYNTGDVVRQVAGGNLVVVGREKDVVNRGGEKITAEEVETFALRLPSVAQAAVVAMPDHDLGERICLFAVATPGETVRLPDIRASLLASGLARFKLPERLIVVDTLPLTGVGKVDKKALRGRL
ncbi:(2,3-dihydroxybenzoyl)adenylate synthase [Asanoa siamensis]|nr:AMP-binding protein [Asanoa siamensis]